MIVTEQKCFKKELRLLKRKCKCEKIIQSHYLKKASIQKEYTVEHICYSSYNKSTLDH